MKKYDYREAMVQDIIDYIKDNNIYIDDEDNDKIEDQLNDELWDNDQITGNGGKFYASEEKCQEYVATNLILYFEAATEFNYFPNYHSNWIYIHPAQYMDSTIRCFLLRECIWRALKKLRKE